MKLYKIVSPATSFTLQTLTVKAGELAQNVREGATKEEVRNELRRRLEELSATSECSCIACMDSHEKSATEREIPLCYCGCHRDDDRLLIHAYGETDSTPPRAIAFKIVSGEMVNVFFVSFVCWSLNNFCIPAKDLRN